MSDQPSYLKNDAEHFVSKLQKKAIKANLQTRNILIFAYIVHSSFTKEHIALRAREHIAWKAIAYHLNLKKKKNI